MIQPPLLTLLGAAWSLGSAVNALAWGHGGAAAGFALHDGSVAIGRIDWPGAPTLRARPGGGVEVVPSTAPPPPLVRATAHAAPCLALTGSGAGFLSGGADGQLTRIAADGRAAPVLTSAEGPIVGVVETSLGWAFIAGRSLHQGGGSSAPTTLPALASALLADAKRRRLAVRHAAGLTLWSTDRSALHWPPPAGSRVGAGGRTLAWSPDGSHLSDGAQLWQVADGNARSLEGAVEGPGSVAFSHDGRLVIGAADSGARAWPVDGRSPPLPCGPADARAPVTAVAAHPRRALVAIGYHNGTVVLCPPGGTDLMFARAAGGGAVACLAFAPDGSGLAFATAGGEVGLIRLPDLLFRSGQGAEQGGTER